MGVGAVIHGNSISALALSRGLEEYFSFVDRRDCGVSCIVAFLGMSFFIL